MKIRGIIAPLLFAGFVGVIPVSSHAFNLAQMLGRGEDQDLNTFKLIHVADLKALLAKNGDKLHIYDANVAATRNRFGTIPGATLLSSDDNYPLSVLPPNKHATLVFYCANTHWMASHEAARRAVKAGYTNVSVMADGISGWKSAGEPTVSAPSSEARQSG